STIFYLAKGERINWSVEHMSDLQQHTYEEIRDVVIEVLLRPPPDTVTRFARNGFPGLVAGVGVVFFQREDRQVLPTDGDRLHPLDRELVRDVFWDLFRQGIITLGINDANPAWPWYRLSHFGEKALQGGLPRIAFTIRPHSWPWLRKK